MSAFQLIFAFIFASVNIIEKHIGENFVIFRELIPFTSRNFFLNFTNPTNIAITIMGLWHM